MRRGQGQLACSAWRRWRGKCTAGYTFLTVGSGGGDLLSLGMSCRTQPSGMKLHQKVQVEYQGKVLHLGCQSSLPREVVTISSLSEFKKHLKSAFSETPSFIQSCKKQGVGLDDPNVSLPAQDTLSFYHSSFPSGKLTAQCHLKEKLGGSDGHRADWRGKSLPDPQGDPLQFHLKGVGVAVLVSALSCPHTISLQICWYPLSFLQCSITFAASASAAHLGQTEGTKGPMVREVKRRGKGLQVTLLKQENMRPKYFTYSLAKENSCL